MEVWRKQCLLAYCGYYPYKDIDGEWGDQSRKATEAFQRDYQITVDGVFGDGTLGRILKVIYNHEEPATQTAPVDKIPENSVAVDKGNLTTGTFWDEIEFFTREEFRCKCGGRYCNGFPAEPHEATVRYADAVRRRVGKPIPVNSGLRCKTWNQIQGGVSNSNHLTGGAVDLGRPSGVTPAQMKAEADAVMGNNGGIGIYDWGIHIDDGVYSRWDERS